MKKITLTSILLFALIVGALYVGSMFEVKNNQTTSDKSIGTSPNKTSNKDIVKNTNTTNNKNVGKNTNTTDNKSIETSTNKTLNNIDISNVKFKSEPTSPDTFTKDEALKHNKKNDCYLIINNKVYDVSSYIGYHPGGARTITSRCGEEVTGIFARIHSNRAWDLLKKYKIGTITTNKQDTTSQKLNAIEDALKKANPGVDVIKVAPKQDFYIAKLIFNKKLYEIHINNSGQIIKEEIEDDESDWSTWESDNDDK